MHLALGEVPFPGLECVTLVGVDKDRMVHLMHLLFSVRFNVYSTELRLFAYLGDLPAEVFPPVMKISPDFFAARRFVHAVPRKKHIAHLGGISPLNWQTKPCRWAIVQDHINLALREMAFFPSDCVAWLLGREGG